MIRVNLLREHDPLPRLVVNFGRIAGDCYNDDCPHCVGRHEFRYCIEEVAVALNLHHKVVKRVLSAYRTGARRRKLEFTLPEEQFRELMSDDCAYCGGHPANCAKVSDAGRVWLLRYQGIDRVDNARGYVPDNVVSCCSACNFVKGTLPADQMRERAERLVRVLGRAA